jgi:gamma-glutamylcyclotransferase (GGCT)/AIG2-like uncharacterized protein YtfP
MYNLKTITKKVPVFVYGTLKKGERAYSKLKGSKLIAMAELQPEYKLLNCGRYPALVKAKNGTNTVSGEIYEVAKDVLQELHDYEGVSNGLFYFDYLSLGEIQIVNQPQTNLTKMMLNRSLAFGYLCGNQNSNLPEIEHWSTDSLCSLAIH